MIQISTPNTDYIFDVIALRKSIRDYLQAILENPLIVKIFYSGENDLFWLKRDFSISVINYFDIKTAALFLNKTMDCSLVNLIETFCEIGKMDKKNKKILQVSNWFERPLTIEQLNYAAMDSHYLIYLREKLLGSIFEKIKNLKQIISFFELMEATSKKKYQQKVFNNSEFYELFNRLFKANKIILLKKKNDLEEEKKFESEEKSNNDKKQMQFYFIKLAEMRDKYARMKNVGIEEICSTDGLFHLSKKTIVSLPEDIIKSIDLQEKDMNFVKMNLKEIAEIFKTKNEEIIEEIEKISRSNKVQTNLHNEKRKQDRMKQISELFSRKSPAYENCSILAPDGYMLWYYMTFFF